VIVTLRYDTIRYDNAGNPKRTDGQLSQVSLSPKAKTEHWRKEIFKNIKSN